MNINDLEYFAEIIKSRSITRASKNTYISPQGLSSAVKRMEKELGIELLERSPKGVVPNEYGQIVLKRSLEILESYAVMQNEIRDLIQRNQGLIRLIVIRLLTPDFIFGFINGFPDIQKWNVYVITKKDKVLSRNLKVFKEYILKWNIL